MARSAQSVFISYARESEEHSAWVTNLAARLEVRTEFDVVFDRYDLHAGKDLLHFMDRAAQCEKVVVVVTPGYTERAGSRSGGVGYESSVISADLLSDQLSGRVIPVLRAGDDVPAFLKSKLYVDFRSDDEFETALTELVSALLGLAPAQRPQKGSDPAVSATRGSPQVVEGPGPVIIATLPVPPHVSEYFGPIVFENVGERDAFNIDIADMSNRSQLARFGRIPRMRPGEKIELAPVIDRAQQTRNGMPDLYAFAWIGQIGHLWDLVTDQADSIPRSEIDKAADRTFVAPMRISYIDAANRAWITHSELLFGNDRAGQHRLAIEFRRVERVAP
jgi:hypothetical protein